MKLTSTLTCPNCTGNSFTAKHEATYVYSYQIDAPSDKEAFLPFLFDHRDHVKSYEYIECNSCHRKYPCEFKPCDNGVEMTILQKAIRADHRENPEFLG